MDENGKTQLLKDSSNKIDLINSWGKLTKGFDHLKNEKDKCNDRSMNQSFF